MKICQNLHLYTKIICWRFYIKTPITFWDMRAWDMWKVYLQTIKSSRICSKLPYFLKNLQTSLANSSRIVRIKYASISEHCFSMNTNIYGHFQICISVPSIIILKLSISIRSLSHKPIIKTTTKSTCSVPGPRIFVRKIFCKFLSKLVRQLLFLVNSDAFSMLFGTPFRWMPLNYENCSWGTSYCLCD